MDIALYHPELGYYRTKNPIIQDFITAPEVNSIFGRCVGLWVLEQHKRLNCDIHLIELGPGSGSMMRDILGIISDYIHPSVHMVEISQTLREIQRKKIKYDMIQWHTSIQDVPKGVWIVVANEFFDALPVRQFAYYKNHWNETGIAIQDEKLEFCSMPAWNYEFILPQDLKENSVIEINQDANCIAKYIGNVMREYDGAALIGDYGYIDKPYMSTLQAMRDNTKLESILMHVSDADITAHVDFGVIINSMRCLDYNFMSQGEFLESMGIDHVAHNDSINYLRNAMRMSFLEVFR